jgi:hypothetical protein
MLLGMLTLFLRMDESPIVAVLHLRSFMIRCRMGFVSYAKNGLRKRRTDSSSIVP